MGMVYFGDIAEERRETIKTKPENCPIVGLEHITPGDIRLSDWDTGVENTFTKVFRKGDILFGRRRAYLKKAAVAPFDGICSGDITTIKAKGDKILPELLPFIVQNDTFFDFAVGKSAGSLSPRVKWEHLKTYQLNLPSMEEQKRLAKILMAAEETRQAYKKLIKQTDKLIQTEFMRILNLSEITYQPLSSVLKKAPKSKFGVGDVKELGKGSIICFTSGAQTYFVNEYLVEGEYLFMNDGGVADVKYYDGKSCYTDHVFAFTVSDIKPKFLYYYLLTQIDVINRDLFKGATLKNLDKKKFAEFQIPVINDNTQLQIIHILEQIEQTKLCAQQSLDALNETVCALVNRNFN